MEDAARCPGRRAGAIGLLVWKRLRSRRVGPGRHSGHGNTSVTCSLYREMEAWLLRREEGMSRAERVLNT